MKRLRVCAGSMAIVVVAAASSFAEPAARPTLRMRHGKQVAQAASGQPAGDGAPGPAEPAAPAAGQPAAPDQVPPATGPGSPRAEPAPEAAADVSDAAFSRLADEATP